MAGTIHNEFPLFKKKKSEILKYIRANENLGRSYNCSGSQLVGKPETSRFSSTGTVLTLKGTGKHTAKKGSSELS